MRSVSRCGSTGPRVAVVLLAAAVSTACDAGAGDDAGRPVRVVAEFALGAPSPFVLTPSPGPHVQLGPPPAGPPPSGPVPSGPVPEPGGVPSFEPSIAWVDDGRYLAVVTFGSSSCPSGPDGVEVTGDQEVEIALRERFPDREVCTADMSGFVTVVELPDGVSPTEALTARLAGHEVTIPAVGR